jgi:hypothetical protein
MLVKFLASTAALHRLRQRPKESFVDLLRLQLLGKAGNLCRKKSLIHPNAELHAPLEIPTLCSSELV